MRLLLTQGKSADRDFPTNGSEPAGLKKIRVKLKQAFHSHLSLKYDNPEAFDASLQVQSFLQSSQVLPVVNQCFLLKEPDVIFRVHFQELLYQHKEMNPFHTVSYTHLRAHETDSYLVCRLLLE